MLFRHVEGEFTPHHLDHTQSLCLSKVTSITRWLHDHCPEVLTVHGNELRLLWTRHSPYSNYFYRATDMKAVETIFNVFSYDEVSARDSNRTPWSWQWADVLRVAPQSKVFFLMAAQPLYIKILLWTECKSSGVHEGYGDTNSFLGGVSAHWP